MGSRNCETLETAGASVFNSNVVNSVVARAADRRGIDGWSNWKAEDIRDLIETANVEFVHTDLRKLALVGRAGGGTSAVCRLGAEFGGGVYFKLYQAARFADLIFDGIVLRACRHAKAARVVYSSCGCAYLNHIQTAPTKYSTSRNGR